MRRGRLGGARQVRGRAGPRQAATCHGKPNPNPDPNSNPNPNPKPNPNQGDTLLAEATRNDKIWGVGVDLGDPALADPRRWRGTNVLGWCLMEARSSLGGAGVPGAAAAAAAAAVAAAAAGDAGGGTGKAVARGARPPKPKRQKS